MPPFQTAFEPVALVGQFVRLLPSDAIHEVRAVEQLPISDDPLNFGAVSAGGTASDSDGNTSILVSESEMDQGELGQFRIQPVSPVKISVRQTGREERRFDASNEIGQIGRYTPQNQREVYVFETGEFYVVVENRNQYDLTQSLVAIDGWKLVLSDRTFDSVDRAAAVPVGTLRRTAQLRGQQTQGGSRAGQAAPRNSGGVR